VSTELLRRRKGFAAKIAAESTSVFLFEVVPNDSSWWKRRGIKFSHSGDLLKLYLVDLSLANLLRSKLIGHCIFCLSRVLLPVGLKFLDRGFILQLRVKKIATSRVISDFGKEVYVSLTWLFPIDFLKTKGMIGVWFWLVELKRV